MPVHDAGHALLETAAAAILVVGGSVLLVLAMRARRIGGSASLLAEPPTPAPELGVAIPATLSVAAAVIHFGAVPSHLEPAWLLGVGFVAAATYQAAWALGWLIQPSRAMARIGLLGNGAIVAAWVVSRTVGLPLGGLAGRPEAVGGPDLLAATLELALAGCLALRLMGIDRALGRRFGRRREAATALIVPVVGLVMVATTLALAGLTSHGHEPGAEHAPPAGPREATTAR